MDKPKKARPKPTPPEGRRFQPGQSGNPAGRPKVIQEFRAACQDKWNEVLDTWSEIMLDRDRDPLSRIRAAELIANYAFGRPSQAHQLVDGSDKPMSIVDVMRAASRPSEEADE